jgi:hypothetical protein
MERGERGKAMKKGRKVRDIEKEGGRKKGYSIKIERWLWDVVKR